MANGIFVTGTDTGVGKTYVSCLLIRWLRSKGIDVGAMKPVETGCAAGDGDLVPADALKLAEAAGSSDDMSLVAPCRFSLPVAPMVAAAEEGRPIDPEVLRSCFREISSRHSFTLVEGAGGLLVPITPMLTMRDLAADMGLPVLVVAASKLGVINHCLLTHETVVWSGLTVAGIVLNNLDGGSDDARRTNAEALMELVSELVIELGFGATEDDVAAMGKLLLC